MKTAKYQYKNRHAEQYNKTETPEINGSIYNPLIFDKQTKISSRRRTVSSTGGAMKIVELPVHQLMIALKRGIF